MSPKTARSIAAREMGGAPEQEQEGLEQRSAIQKKSLTVSSPDEADEHEADEIAQRVVNGHPVESYRTSGAVPANGKGAVELTANFRSKLAASKASGDSLDQSTRNEMESKMRADFSTVRIHTGVEAHEMNERLGAKAFAHGEHVYFAGGNYSPHSQCGKELLAHELVHTRQQRATRGSDPAANPIQAKKVRPGVPQNWAIVIVAAPFYKDKGGNECFADLQPQETVEILGQTDGEWTSVRRTADGNEFDGYVRSEFVEPMKQLKEVVVEYANLTETERLEYKNAIVDQLNDLLVSDLDVFTALGWFERLFATGDLAAFAKTVIELRDGGYLDRLFGELSTVHYATQFYIISRLAVFMPRSELLDPADLALIGRSEPLLQKAQGKSTYAERVDRDIKDFLELKYQEINYLTKSNNTEAVVAEIEGLFDVLDALLGLLFSEDLSHFPVTGTSWDYLLDLYEFREGERSADPAVTITDVSGGNEMSLSELLAGTPPGTSQDTTGVEAPNNPSPQQVGSGQPPSLAQSTGEQSHGASEGTAPGMREQMKQLIVVAADRLNDFLYQRLFPLFDGSLAGSPQKEYLPTEEQSKNLLAATKAMLEKRREGKTAEINRKGLPISDRTDLATLGRLGSLDTMTWMDLANTWFYELGAKNLSRTKEISDKEGRNKDRRADRLAFGPNALTTQQLRGHPTAQRIVQAAWLLAARKEYETRVAHIPYGTAAFFEAAPARDVVKNFLGSFFVIIEFDTDNRLIKFSAYNEASWESATRFRNVFDASTGKFEKKGFIESYDRGEAPVPIGGTLPLEWSWTEQFPIEWAFPGDYPWQTPTNENVPLELEHSKEKKTKKETEHKHPKSQQKVKQSQRQPPKKEPEDEWQVPHSLEIKPRFD